MSHEVETMAYTNEVPWHGLGTRVDEAPSVPDMLKLAQLDWKVNKQPMEFIDEEGYHPVDGFYALVRDKDNKVFDISGKVYTPCQNSEAFEFFVEFTEKGQAMMETAGSLRGGKYVWGLANLNASFHVTKADEVKGYLLVVCPHEVGKSLIFKFTPVRVVCQNTLSLALRDGRNEFRMPHRTTFDAQAMSKAKDALGIARDAVGELEKSAKMLKKLKLSDDDFISKILMPMFMPKEVPEEVLLNKDKLSPRIQQIMGAYRNAPGADPGTGWGALNAVTYFADHMASRTADKRMTNAWLGKTSLQKNKTLTKLLEMA